MRGFQSKASEVRRVLESLSDAGIVERVRLAPVNKEAKLPEGKTVKLDRKTMVMFTVPGRSLEKRYGEIQSLLRKPALPRLVCSSSIPEFAPSRLSLGRVAQPERASALKAEGCRFEPCRSRQTCKAPLP